ncbi:D-alanyl-D-alanine carboxypeptidase [Rhodospirillum rubrum]|uniref:D-alanyl-D-alanine carboxypeptidase family protein n=1 Tax=Rhodospirillum rubrum TaxID=1085 RepID=UPI001903E68C|nr:D-alanyl-D-alanine carboxypeptidase family protein [Rhodospirillum rubrum]MBK1665625.1 D-alanyl-D-alanine carboxypeptidase [Rhodospirillum rubrum]MBK1677470.1 D-alanyl-D-alanine carboxypeptidase [Rhodospirillum rubrum]
MIALARHLTPFVLAAGLLTAMPAQAFETKARHALVIDLDTDTVLLDKDAEVPMPPSSMSKLMTAYMLFERLKSGSLSLDDAFTVSENAWRKGGAASGGSTMFLNPGAQVKVHDLMRGIIVQSGNDACVVVAENLAGDEASFAAAMNRRAKELGLTNSHFVNATGLPDPDHYMTAHDLVTLAEHIIRDFPEFYEIYGETEFTYNGILQHNRNPLLYMNMGADGLKTGHTNIAGFGLTASAVQDGRRLVMVINGLQSNKERSEEAERLMSWGFRNFETVTLLKAGQPISDAEVWMGEEETVPLVSVNDLKITLPRAARRDMVAKAVFDTPIPAPIHAGDRIATLVLSGPDMAKLEYPLVAGRAVEKLSFFGRILVSARNAVFGTVQPAAQ